MGNAVLFMNLDHLLLYDLHLRRADGGQCLRRADGGQCPACRRACLRALAVAPHLGSRQVLQVLHMLVGARHARHYVEGEEGDEMQRALRGVQEAVVTGGGVHCDSLKSKTSAC